MQNPFLISILPALLFGIVNGLYWRRKGYTGWHLFYLGTMAFYALCLMAWKFLG